MALNWRYLYPFSTAGTYFVRRRTLWMSYGLFIFLSSLLFFCEKWMFFFYRWYDFERHLKQTAQDSTFQGWIFLLLLFLGVMGILWIGLALIFFLYSRSCYKQFLFSEGEKSVTIRFLVGQSLPMMAIEETLFSWIGIGSSFLIGGIVGGWIFERAFHDFSQFYQLPAGLLNSGSSVTPWAWHLLIAFLVVLGCFLGYKSWLPKIVNRHEIH
jgi:hypothetical protein